MIFAAGLGTRFKPWTDIHPKALALVNGKSLLQRNIEYLQQFGIRDVVVNVHHFSGQLIAAIKDNNGWGSTVRISDESDAVLETAGGLKKAGPLLTAENIVVINADILTDLDLQAMLAYHLREKPVSTLAVTNRETSRYFLFNADDTLCGWRNVKTGEEIIRRPSDRLTQKAFSGIHIISRQLISLITKEGKYGIVDAYLDLAANHLIKSFDHSGGILVDVGKPESVVEAERFFQ